MFHSNLVSKRAVLAALILSLGLLLAAQPAQAQGPYGRNGYDDFPFNQGSLFYRPLKPAPKPKPRRPVVVNPATRTYTMPPQGGTATAQPPYTAAPQPRYYSYYAAPR
jgi:hypothetical protein